MNYDSEYFFLTLPDEKNLPFLVPDENTQRRRFRVEAQPSGSAPLVFRNGYKDDNKKANIETITPDILFAGSSLVVCTRIRDKLLPMNLPNLAIHPVVYIDDKDKWHEDYWFLTFTSDFDCWDREKSDFDDEPIKIGTSELHQVYTYKLNAKLLDNTPLNERLLFRMGGDLDGYVCCHDSLRAIFAGGGLTGAKIECLADQ